MDKKATIIATFIFLIIASGVKYYIRGNKLPNCYDSQVKELVLSSMNKHIRANLDDDADKVTVSINNVYQQSKAKKEYVCSATINLKLMDELDAKTEATFTIRPGKKWREFEVQIETQPIELL